MSTSKKELVYEIAGELAKIEPTIRLAQQHRISITVEEKEATETMPAAYTIRVTDGTNTAEVILPRPIFETDLD